MDNCPAIKPLCRELSVSYMLDKMECFYGIYFLHKYANDIINYPTPKDKIYCNKGGLTCNWCGGRFVDVPSICRKDIYDFLD